MSLVGFKAENHPQQSGKRGARPEVDERATDPNVFRDLDARFGFTLDVCALERNAKCERFYSPEEDGLAQPWTGERVWCNPPYSSIEPWVQKAWASQAELVVMLVPANRTEQGWWQRHVEPSRDRGGALASRVLARSYALHSLRPRRNPCERATALRRLLAHLGAGRASV